MPVELIKHPAGLGDPRGRYSHVSIATGTEIVTVAGQLGTTVSGSLAGDGSVSAQTRQVFENIATALRSAGLGAKDIFKTTTYLVGANNIAEFMEARTAVFGDLFPDGGYPPNTLLIVAGLVEEQFSVEVEAFAVRAAG
jgi:enamine deaminase RidA (YjgF/YER057c/UK114 family)